jgi:hypothetical protein
MSSKFGGGACLPHVIKAVEELQDCFRCPVTGVYKPPPVKVLQRHVKVVRL